MFFSTRLGRIGGIDFFIHPTFWLLLGWVILFQGGVLGGLLTAAAFACVVLHELGHAYAARWYGIPTRSITLYPVGGVARLERMPKRPGPELVIALAGPAVNFALAGVLGAAHAAGSWIDPAAGESLVGELVRLLIWVNLALGLFNLIPAFPMDGGRVLRAILAGRLGRLRATEIAASVGQTLALTLPVILLVTGHLSFWNLLLAGFVYLAAGAERAAVRWEAWEEPRSGRATAPVWGEPGAGVTSIPPAGYRWVRRGAGLWQLVPIGVHEAS
jgi:Zn-dependent protease